MGVVGWRCSALKPRRWVPDLALGDVLASVRESSWLEGTESVAAGCSCCPTAKGTSSMTMGP